jgi:hypothetical protein
MNYQVTYAFDSEEVYVVKKELKSADVVGAVEEAMLFIEEDHGPGKSLELVGFSILKVADHHDN